MLRSLFKAVAQQHRRVRWLSGFAWPKAAMVRLRSHCMVSNSSRSCQDSTRSRRDSALRLLSLCGRLVRLGRLFREDAFQNEVGVDLQSSQVLVKGKAFAVAGEV